MNLIEALKHQTQLDDEGVMCGVSRQALDEAIERIAELEAKLAKERAMIPCRTAFSTRTIDGLACVCFVMPEGVDWSDCELRVPRKIMEVDK